MQQTKGTRLLPLIAVAALVMVVLALNHPIFNVEIAKRFKSMKIFQFSDYVTSPHLPLCPAYNSSAAPKGSPIVHQPLGPCNFCRVKHKTDGRFHDFTTPNIRFFVYSAFYDDRESLMGSPVVRLVTVGNSVGHLKGKNDTFFCVLYHSLGTKRVEMGLDAVGAGPDYRFAGISALTLVHTCPTEGVMPHSVSVVRLTGDRVTSCMPVEYPTKVSNKKDFVVCVPVAYGNLDPYRLIEWIEVQRLMGVDRIAVYDLYVGNQALSVLEHYEQEGFVELRKMQLVDINERHAHLMELATALTDCLYRHMNDYKRIIVSDFDEFIKPLKHKNLQELVGYLERTVNSSVNHVIRNSYFLLGIPPDVNMSSHYTIMRYRHRAPVSPMWHRVKPIILTSSCIHLYSHQCVLATKEFAKQILTESTDPQLALVYHYRHCPLPGPECQEATVRAAVDDTMLAYKDILTRRVKRTALVVLNTTIA